MFSNSGYELIQMNGINRSVSIKGKIISKLLIGAISDMKYIQFACLARPKNH